MLRRRVNDADGLAAMPLAPSEGARHAMIERLNGRIKNATGRVEMVRPERIRVAR
jgi:hypothetical protein